ncbi:MAG: hypothetical protein JXA37_02380 [Chloroflexia bacterium]|nr:hypothetical protein [Chloroflexia bacterium]
MGLPSPEVLEARWQRARRQGGDPAFLLAVRGGLTGVLGVLDGGPGPAIALRFDMDALEMAESRDSEHRPFREGFVFGASST